MSTFKLNDKERYIRFSSLKLYVKINSYDDPQTFKVNLVVNR